MNIKKNVNYALENLSEQEIVIVRDALESCLLNKVFQSTYEKDKAREIKEGINTVLSLRGN